MSMANNNTETKYYHVNYVKLLSAGDREHKEQKFTAMKIHPYKWLIGIYKREAEANERYRDELQKVFQESIKRYDANVLNYDNLPKRKKMTVDKPELYDYINHAIAMQPRKAYISIIGWQEITEKEYKLYCEYFGNE